MATSTLLPAVQGPPPDDPLPGMQLGTYKIERAVAAGGMGIVYVARHGVLGRNVAIKVLRPEYARNEEQTARFLKEAQAIAGIHHRGIVTVEDFGALPDGRQYMVMEFLEGETLEQLVQRDAPLHANRALPILDEVLDALSAAHKVGVVHRDLKPSNVFLTMQSNGARYCKLVDFGLAQRSVFSAEEVPAFAKASLVAGTPEYVSPEQARGLVATARTDLYCCGVILYELLTGHLPFTAPSLMELLQKQVYSKAPRVSASVDVPVSLDDLVASMLEKDPELRPRSADVVRQAIARVLKEMKEESTQYVSRPAPLTRGGAPKAEPVLEDTLISGSQLATPGPKEPRSDGRGKKVPAELLAPPKEPRSDGRGKKVPAELLARAPAEVSAPPAEAVTPKVDPQMERTLDGNSSEAMAALKPTDGAVRPASTTSTLSATPQVATSGTPNKRALVLALGAAAVVAILLAAAVALRNPDEAVPPPRPQPIVRPPPPREAPAVKKPPDAVPQPEPQVPPALPPKAETAPEKNDKPRKNRPGPGPVVAKRPEVEKPGSEACQSADWVTPTKNEISRIEQAKKKKIPSDDPHEVEKVQAVLKRASELYQALTNKKLGCAEIWGQLGAWERE